MGITTVYRVRVLDRDCGPDKTVPFHRYTRWMDAATHQHLLACGVPPPDPVADPPLPKAPLTEAQITILEQAMHRDLLQFHTRVLQWRDDEVELTHRVLRGDVLICEAHETRTLCQRCEPGCARRSTGSRAPLVH